MSDWGKNFWPAVSTASDIGMNIASNYANMAMQDKAFAYNTAMWRMQNEYNLPANQRQRLEDAGLNPALMYGGSFAGGNVAKDMPQYKAPNLDFNLRSNPLLMLSAYQDITLKKAQKEQIEEQTERIRVLTGRDRWSWGQDIKWDDIERDVAVDERRSRIMLNEQRYELTGMFEEAERSLGLKHGTLLYESDQAYLDLERKLEVDIGRSELRRNEASIKLLYQQAIKTAFEAQFLDETFVDRKGQVEWTMRKVASDAVVAQIERDLYETARKLEVGSKVANAILQTMKFVVIQWAGKKK